ncbi:MAG: TRAP transporter large permease subunit [Pseudomonadota bacterium]
MGTLLSRSGIAAGLFAAANHLLGRLPGGLAMAAVMSCGGFAAVSGSSLATAATMSRVAMPPLRRFGYHDELASGTIAAGGTLGILVVVVTEISLITPPIGMNVFILRGVLRDISFGTIFRGVAPFWIADLLRLARLALFPAISLFLL